MSLALGFDSPVFSFVGTGSSIGGIGTSAGGVLGGRQTGGGTDTNIFGPIDEYPPADGSGGRDSGSSITNIINSIGNAVANVGRSVTGNYPPAQQSYSTPQTQYVPAGYHRDSSGQLVADAVGQTASSLTRTIANNSGLILAGVVGFIAVSALKKSGR